MTTPAAVVTEKNGSQQETLDHTFRTQFSHISRIIFLTMITLDTKFCAFVCEREMKNE